eukprot:NODE_748_length_1933_cov_31.000000_g693_i0.p1 GENE.NODE_748_length_1933_cov_31.000000_g693_i0~~NODE_748_length_1933_cov_31.000000_g693_i0.p1  ORF type:complete len:569 (+),score=57.89 NODE_748_length_1933_cov_31.000000_g693_i0:74-1708(+)
MEILSGDRKLLEQNLKHISKLINQEKDPYQRFVILHTYLEVVKDLVLSNFVTKREFEPAMAYLAKVSPQRPVPRHVQVLSRCGIVIQEELSHITLVCKNTRAACHVIKNDCIGSGSAALKVASAIYAQEVDGQEYYVDFTEEERRRDVERYTKGKITYEQYCENKEEGVQLPEYETRVFFDEEDFTMNWIPTVNCKSSHSLDADSFEEAYQVFKNTGFAMCAATRYPEKIQFKLEGHTKHVCGKVVHLIPIKERCDLAKGPEFDEIIDAILTVLRKAKADNDAAVKEKEKKTGEVNAVVIPIGAMEYEPKSTHKDSMKLMGKEYLEVTVLRQDYADEASEDIANLLEGQQDMLYKYRAVKFDFENNRENLQINRETYDDMMEKAFVVPKSYKTMVTEMKKKLAHVSFDELAWEGALATRDYLATPAYAQSVAASKGRKSYADAGLLTCFSIFLDNFIKSPASFPEMQLSSGGVRRFLTGIGNKQKADPKKDAYELFRNSTLETQKNQDDLDAAHKRAQQLAEEKAKVEYEKMQLLRDQENTDDV